MNRSTGQPASLLSWMDSLADETRLRLLHLLERQELGVVELCDILQLPQSTVSRHLKVLSDQKWVRSRRLATTHLYRTILDELDPAARKLWLLAREQTQNWATLKQDELRLQRRLREREIDSQEFFAGAAAQWDHLRRELYGESFSVSAMLALLPRDMIVADLGCGTGATIEQLAPHVRQIIGVDNSPAMLKAAKKRLAAFTSADIAKLDHRGPDPSKTDPSKTDQSRTDQSQTDQVRANPPRAGQRNSEQPRVDLRRGDLQTLPIDDASVDAALLLLALTYVPDPEVVVREMSRILKPGGRAIIVDLLPHDRDDFRRELGQLHAGFSEAAMKNLLTSAGLDAPTLTGLPPEPNAKGPALFLASAIKSERSEVRLP
ncbi:MAG: metalloregulator ArsR/SmtB family transcription factor [Anaerolineae bacterium]|nr:metalloregulator ArsR/SmtB family transcription factor [Phycisphaerae bacterium]